MADGRHFDKSKNRHAQRFDQSPQNFAG